MGAPGVKGLPRGEGLTLDLEVAPGPSGCPRCTGVAPGAAQLLWASRHRATGHGTAPTSHSTRVVSQCEAAPSQEQEAITEPCAGVLLACMPAACRTCTVSLAPIACQEKCIGQVSGPLPATSSPILPSSMLCPYASMCHLNFLKIGAKRARDEGGPKTQLSILARWQRKPKT